MADPTADERAASEPAGSRSNDAPQQRTLGQKFMSKMPAKTWQRVALASAALLAIPLLATLDEPESEFPDHGRHDGPAPADDEWTPRPENTWPADGPALPVPDSIIPDYQALAGQACDPATETEAPALFQGTPSLADQLYLVEAYNSNEPGELNARQTAELCEAWQQRIQAPGAFRGLSQGEKDALYAIAGMVQVAAVHAGQQDRLIQGLDEAFGMSGRYDEFTPSLTENPRGLPRIMSNQISSAQGEIRSQAFGVATLLDADQQAQLQRAVAHLDQGPVQSGVQELANRDAAYAVPSNEISDAMIALSGDPVETPPSSSTPTAGNGAAARPFADAAPHLGRHTTQQAATVSLARRTAAGHHSAVSAPVRRA